MLHAESFDGDARGVPSVVAVRDGYGFEARVVNPTHGDGVPVVVAVTGEIDMSTAGLLWQVLEPACERGGRLVVDLDGTTFIDSTGLAVLVRAYKRLEQRSESVVVRTAAPVVRHVLAISGLDGLLMVETPELSAG